MKKKFKNFNFYYKNYKLILDLSKIIMLGLCQMKCEHLKTVWRGSCHPQSILEGRKGALTAIKLSSLEKKDVGGFHAFLEMM